LLNADIFSGKEVGENAKLLLKFVRHAEKLNEHANSHMYAGIPSARDPRGLNLASHTLFDQGWGTTYDLGLPTAPEALGKIYKKNAMKPMRHSLQLKKEAPFGASR